MGCENLEVTAEAPLKFRFVDFSFDRKSLIPENVLDPEGLGNKNGCPLSRGFQLIVVG